MVVLARGFSISSSTSIRTEVVCWTTRNSQSYSKPYDLRSESLYLLEITVGALSTQVAPQLSTTEIKVLLVHMGEVDSSKDGKLSLSEIRVALKVLENGMKDGQKSLAKQMMKQYKSMDAQLAAFQ